jgi:hypothetical protein
MKFKRTYSFQYIRDKFYTLYNNRFDGQFYIIYSKCQSMLKMVKKSMIYKFDNLAVIFFNVTQNLKKMHFYDSPYR